MPSTGFVEHDACATAVQSTSAVESDACLAVAAYEADGGLLFEAGVFQAGVFE